MCIRDSEWPCFSSVSHDWSDQAGSHLTGSPQIPGRKPECSQQAQSCKGYISGRLTAMAIRIIYVYIIHILILIACQTDYKFARH